MHAKDVPYVLTESGLLQDYAVGSPVNEKAVLYMHSRISSHAECVPSSWALHMLNSKVLHFTLSTLALCRHGPCVLQDYSE